MMRKNDYAPKAATAEISDFGSKADMPRCLLSAKGGCRTNLKMCREGTNQAGLAGLPLLFMYLETGVRQLALNRC